MSIITIGLHGPPNVGKDTASRLLKQSFEMRYQGATYAHSVLVESFARPVYERLAILTGLSVTQLQDRDTKEKVWDEQDAPFPTLVGHSPRSLLQLDGTEHARDQIHPDVWTDHLFFRLKRFIEAEQLTVVIVSDVRFSNEAERLDYVIELLRDGEEYPEERHRSDLRLPDWLINRTVRLRDQDWGQYQDVANTIKQDLLEMGHAVPWWTPSNLHRVVDEQTAEAPPTTLCNAPNPRQDIYRMIDVEIERANKKHTGQPLLEDSRAWMLVLVECLGGLAKAIMARFYGEHRAGCELRRVPGEALEVAAAVVQLLEAEQCRQQRQPDTLDMQSFHTM